LRGFSAIRAAWIGLGYFLSIAVTETAARLGVRLIVFFLAPFALYLLFHRARRHRVIRLFRRARMSPDDLSAVLEKGDRMAIPDPPSVERGISSLRGEDRSTALSGGAGRLGRPDYP
jgi:hypothetical protein